MRVMFAAIPHPSHFYPLIPYAQSLQNAGHEVVIAGPPGAEDAVISAGLTPVSIGEPTPISPENLAKRGLPDPEEMERFAAALGLDGAQRDHWDCFYQNFAFNSRVFVPDAGVPEHQADYDGLIDFARQWQPDLVLWESWFQFGAIIAKACGAPHARILIGADYGGWSLETFRGTDPATVGTNPLVAAIEPVAARYGLEVDDELLLGQVTIDPLPEELRLSKDVETIPVRAISYNGGARKPEWLFTRPEKPRVALSLGLSARLWQFDGDPRLPKLFAALGELDVEVVATLGGPQLNSVETIPDNVRVVDFVPLVQLLPTCSAIILHGATGTFWSALAAGVPQVLPTTDEPNRMIYEGEGENVKVRNAERDGDSWFMSKYLTDTSAGVWINHQTETVEEIRAKIDAVVSDPAYREGAAALRKEWLAKPSPADLIPEFVRLAESGRSA
jgi:UDP:flavonoid glycosyltransferase YjiC (YdhE family)